MATCFKRIAERTLLYSGVASCARAVVHPSSAILAYHNIVPEGESPVGDLSLHTDQAVFGAQLDWLGEHCTVVTLQDLLAGEARQGQPPRVAITFDDAYQGTLTAGLDELRSRELPSTVFVPPGLLGREGFWWDLISHGTDQADADLRMFALNQLHGQQDRILAFMKEQGRRMEALPEHARPAQAGSLHAAVGENGENKVVYGNHTWSHPNLAQISTGVARAEVERARDWLDGSGLPALDFLAYPYGIPGAAGTQVSEGFRKAVLVEGGLCEVRGRLRGHPHLVPRINVPRGVSIEGLALRIAGVVAG